MNWRVYFNTLAVFWGVFAVFLGAMTVFGRPVEWWESGLALVLANTSLIVAKLSGHPVKTRGTE